MSDDLRCELEAAHKAYYDALLSRDATACLAAAILPPQIPLEKFSAFFEGFAADELASGPDLADRQFVILKTVGEDLAGYYSTWLSKEDSNAACVALTVFCRTPEGWKVRIGGTVVNFTPTPGEDIALLAMKIIESDEDMGLEPVASRDAPTGQPNAAVEAALQCMAYDCEMSININGAKLRFRGGQSHSQLLQVVREGAPPEDPYVLRLGKNEITLTYRRKADGPPTSLEIELQAGVCLRMEAARGEGKLSGSFVVPPAGTPFGEIDRVEITDAVVAPAEFRRITVAPSEPRFAFSVEAPSDWPKPVLPENAADSPAEDDFRPVAALMAPYGAVVVTLAVRPAPASGTVVELLARLSQYDQVVLDDIGPAMAGNVQGVGAMGTQPSGVGQMTVRVVMFEQGGWVFSLLAMAPSAVLDSVAPTFEHMFASFALANPAPSTMPAWPAEGPLDESEDEHFSDPQQSAVDRTEQQGPAASEEFNDLLDGLADVPPDA